MQKTVKIRFDTTDEIKRIIANYAGVKPENVSIFIEDSKNIVVVVEKELTFPAEKQETTSPYSPWIVRPDDTTNPIINPTVTWTSADALSNDGGGR